ncbi:Uncharacterised protein [Budvicia aquatica]|uniref:Uncharacterized protein n=1 Tax=Budvicia aquatica TaxID=82979 RepID=A0A484ZPA6_9GAMM|nr:Uncharacterised protein [Budvicia aquatica]
MMEKIKQTTALTLFCTVFYLVADWMEWVR